MKVTVTEGFQIVGADGNVHTSGVVEVDEAYGRQFIRAGWASEAKPVARQKKAPAASNKKQPVADNK